MQERWKRNMWNSTPIGTYSFKIFIYLLSWGANIIYEKTQPFSTDNIKDLA